MCALFERLELLFEEKNENETTLSPSAFVCAGGEHDGSGTNRGSRAQEAQSAQGFRAQRRWSGEVDVRSSGGSAEANPGTAAGNPDPRSGSPAIATAARSESGGRDSGAGQGRNCRRGSRQAG